MTIEILQSFELAYKEVSWKFGSMPETDAWFFERAMRTNQWNQVFWKDFVQFEEFIHFYVNKIIIIDALICGTLF